MSYLCIYCLCIPVPTYIRTVVGRCCMDITNRASATIGCIWNSIGCSEGRNFLGIAQLICSGSILCLIEGKILVGSGGKIAGFWVDVCCLFIIKRSTTQDAAFSIIVTRRPFMVSVAIISPDIPYVNRNGTTGSKTAQLVCTNQNFARFSMLHCIFCTIALTLEKISKL